ncbi:MAG: hypothetical protein ACLRQF_21570 [Thomasclavelia ramosa]
MNTQGQLPRNCSGIDRTVSVDLNDGQEVGYDIIQTDAAINPGKWWCFGKYGW